MQMYIIILLDMLVITILCSPHYSVETYYPYCRSINLEFH